MLGDHGLHHRPARPLTSARPSHHLGEQVEGGLSRPVAAGVQGKVRIQHPNQGDFRQIQALGHHLGTQEHGYIFLLEMLQNFFMGVHGAHRIGIHPVHGDLREQRL